MHSTIGDVFGALRGPTLRGPTLRGALLCGLCFTLLGCEQLYEGSDAGAGEDGEVALDAGIDASPEAEMGPGGRPEMGPMAPDMAQRPDMRPRPDGGQRPDMGPEGPPDMRPPQGPRHGLTVVAVDRFGVPIAEAVVSIADDRRATDLGGRIRFEPVEGRHVVRVGAPGFAGATRVVELDAEAEVVVALLESSPPVPFDPGVGLDAVVDGVEVQIPPGVIVDADGQPIDGEVSVTVAGLDPTGDAPLPGPQRGVDGDDGEPALLSGVFMAEISLWADGAPAQLGDGTRLQAVMPVPELWRDRLAVGDVVPAWWLDEEQGVWIREGEGQIVETADGIGWQVEVEHLTWWNCDIPREQVDCVRARVVDADGAPVARAEVTLTAPAEGYSTTEVTGPDGTACVEVVAPTRVTGRARYGSQISPPSQLRIADRPGTLYCRDGDCLDLELVLPEPGCVVVDGLGDEGGVVLAAPGVAPIVGRGEGTCIEAPVGTPLTAMGARGEALARFEGRPLSVEAPGDCGAPETCARITVQPPAAERGVIDLAPRALCAGDARGAACFGDDGAGRPLPAMLGRDVLRFAAGENAVCAVDREGQARCVGANHNQLIWSDQPGDFVSDGWRAIDWAPTAFDVALGERLVCVASALGTVSCRTNLEVALGGAASREILAAGGLPLGGVERVRAGVDRACAVTVEGGVHCWLSNADTATLIELPGPATDVSVGRRTACAQLLDGGVHCWGIEAFTGRGSDGLLDGAPAAVATADGAPLSAIARIDGAEDSHCAVGVDGELWCWGAGAEVCDNWIDDDGDGAADCADEEHCGLHPRCRFDPAGEGAEPLPIAEPGGRVGFAGAMDGDEPTWPRLNNGCGARSQGEFFYVAFPVVNRTGVPQELWIEGEFDGDGFLFVFRDPFDPEDDAGCVDANDDDRGIRVSFLDDIVIAPDEVLWLVISTFSPGIRLGQMDITVTTAPDPAQQPPADPDAPDIGRQAWATPVDWSDLPDPPPAVDITLGGQTRCALFDDGRAVCWGPPPVREAGAGLETVHGGPSLPRIRPHADDLFSVDGLRAR